MRAISIQIHRIVNSVLLCLLSKYSKFSVLNSIKSNIFKRVITSFIMMQLLLIRKYEIISNAQKSGNYCKVVAAFY